MAYVNSKRKPAICNVLHGRLSNANPSSITYCVSSHQHTFSNTFSLTQSLQFQQTFRLTQKPDTINISQEIKFRFR